MGLRSVSLTLGETRTGEWCDLCALPAAVQSDVMCSLDGEPAWVLGSVDGCPDCKTGTFADWVGPESGDVYADVEPAPYNPARWLAA